MRSQVRTKPDDTRARIVETAEALFRRLGFAKTAVADIAAIAIVASALLITMGYGAWTLLVCRSEKRIGLNSEGQL